MNSIVTTVSRDYSNENNNIKISKVYSPECKKPWAEIAFNQAQAPAERMGLDSMSDLKDLYNAIGDFLRSEGELKEKGGLNGK